MLMWKRNKNSQKIEEKSTPLSPWSLLQFNIIYMVISCNSFTVPRGTSAMNQNTLANQ